MWLLEQSIFATMKRVLELGFNPTPEQITAFEASRMEASNGGSRILTVAGNNAEINIEGVLTKKSSFMAMLFGGGNSTYSEIITAFAEAEADPDVKEITMKVDSPGGEVDGLFDTLAAIEAVKKPIKAVVSNTAASAAYALVAKADTITAKNNAAKFGSIGIAANFFVSDHEVSIASDKAPKKRPDVKTAAGIKVVKEELNTLHDLFVDSIATGRNVTAKKVNADFGKGAMLYAVDAQKVGMIDAIAGTKLEVVPDNNNNQKTASKGGKNTKGAFMDLKEFKAEHPSTYAEVVAIGKENGKLAERDRVGAFVVAGEQSGDMKTALTAIADGSEMTSTLSTQFMMAAANRSDVQARSEEDDDAGDGATNASADDDANKVVALVQENLGIEGGK